MKNSNWIQQTAFIFRIKILKLTEQHSLMLLKLEYVHSMINHYKYEAHQNMLPVICQGLATKVMHLKKKNPLQTDNYLLPI